MASAKVGSADHLVPRLYGKLARDQRRAAAVAILDDLHRDRAAGWRRAAPGPRSSRIRRSTFVRIRKQFAEAAVAVLQLQLGEETGHARVVDGVAVATSLVSKCARQPRLADAALGR